MVVVYPGKMLGSEYKTQDCSIARALEVVGERWTLLIVRELLARPRRFVDLHDKLGISKNVLTARLDKLVESGVVDKQPYEASRDWNTYVLTAKGLALFPVVHALMAWGDAFMAPSGAPAVFVHSCGHAAGHRVVCESCGESVDVSSVRLTAGPGYAAATTARR
jgi:DNA-binding HxlR family transcriptional regulator